MSIEMYLLAMGSLIVFAVLLFALATIALILGYQLGYRDASYGILNAMPWPPLPEHSKRPAGVLGEANTPASQKRRSAHE